MSLQLKHREKDNKWRAWTAMSDGWLTGWLTENEMKLYLVQRTEQRVKLEAIKIMMSFPNGYAKKESGRFMPVSNFYEWHSEVLKDYDTYDQRVEDKYLELKESL